MVATLVEMLDRAAERFADRVAIEDAAGQAIGYRELAELSRRVQSRLVAEGVRAGDRVGVVVKKSVDTLVAYQATLRAGAAYVPVDPLAPARRAALMLSDCDPRVVLVDHDLAEAVAAELATLPCRPRQLVLPASPEDGRRWRIESLASAVTSTPVTPQSDDLAFVLYTSGSTGKPKGVMLTHRSVVDFVEWCSAMFAPEPSDRFATQAPLQFSLPVFQLYVGWCHGATVVLIDDMIGKTPQLLASVLEARHITVWFSTPTVLSMLARDGELEGRDLSRVRLVMFAGETFPLANLRQLRVLLPHPRYVHILGSTETHISVSYEVHDEGLVESTALVPIGVVAARYHGRVIDEEQQDVPSDVDGELCLSGPGVTAGYWNAPAETARAFFSDGLGRRWYRTGDIVRRRPDGNLVFRGRRDRMVKRRGNRVELSEIEACLYTHADVKEAAVVARSDEEAGVLIDAFVVSNGTRVSVIDLKAHCARALPQYMVPDRIVSVDALPRTSTGKVDYPTLKETVAT